QHLDPYHTPWIWVGGSYGASRDTWMRLRNPEVIFAVWESSAVVESRPAASAYWNAMHRSMPQNCSADMQAAMHHIDD
ncbi:hypothetical protein B0T25DRAFT_418213, partial [Lasiosphaeria hispida]